MLKKTDKQNLSNSKYDPLGDFLKQFKIKSRIAIYLSALGLIIFLIVALVFPFKDKIFKLFFPKDLSEAAVCTIDSQISNTKAGFVFTGGDLSQAMSSLNTSLYYTYDANVGPKKAIYMIGRHANNLSDPSGIRLLMNNNLDNVDFDGSIGTIPNGWKISSEGKGSAVIETALENTISGSPSVKVWNEDESSETKISQVFKEDVSGGQFVVFGGWVKTTEPTSVKILIQNSEQPFQEFGVIEDISEPNVWTFLMGYGKVPDGVKKFEVDVKVKGNNKIGRAHV